MIGVAAKIGKIHQAAAAAVQLGGENRNAMGCRTSLLVLLWWFSKCVIGENWGDDLKKYIREGGTSLSQVLQLGVLSIVFS